MANKTSKNDVSDLDTKNNAATENGAAENNEAAKPAKIRYEGIKNFVYVGPSLPGGRLKSNTVLEGTYDEITAYYKDALEEYPKAAKLIVPVGQLADVRTKAKTPGNIICEYYNGIVSKINKSEEE